MINNPTLNKNPVKIDRALISVFNKTGVIEFAQALIRHGVEILSTGGTAEAGAKLVEKSGGMVSGFVFVINLFDLGGKKLLENKGYKAFSLIDFPGH